MTKQSTELDLKIIIHINKEGLKKGIGPQSHGSKTHTDIMKTEGLKQALKTDTNLTHASGGARRDEEKA